MDDKAPQMQDNISITSHLEAQKPCCSTYTQLTKELEICSRFNNWQIILPFVL